MTHFMLGVCSTLALLGLLLYVYPRLVRALILSLWQVRGSNLFIWAIFDTYLRQKGWRTGWRLGGLHRATRRRIERLRVKLGLL
jgi:hypothetical protein